MRKIIFGLAIFVLLLGVLPKNASAALLTFSKEGEVYWNVLGLSDSSLEVKKIADELASANTSISLANSSGKVSLSYGNKEVDITGYAEDIVEIEETDATSTLYIRAAGEGFSIVQNGVTIETSFPLNVDSSENKLSVETATGEKFLTVLPFEATTQLIRTNIVSTILGGNLVEKEEGEVVYAINGEKQVVLFNVFSFAIPVKVEVSATTGTVMNIDQPLWYSVVDFLLA